MEVNAAKVSAQMGQGILEGISHAISQTRDAQCIRIAP